MRTFTTMKVWKPELHLPWLISNKREENINATHHENKILLLVALWTRSPLLQLQRASLSRNVPPNEIRPKPHQLQNLLIQNIPYTPFYTTAFWELPWPSLLSLSYSTAISTTFVKSCLSNTPASIVVSQKLTWGGQDRIENRDFGDRDGSIAQRVRKQHNGQVHPRPSWTKI